MPVLTAYSTEPQNLGGISFVTSIANLAAEIGSGITIRASHFATLGSLMLTANNHYHAWTDTYGMKTYGNTNGAGYAGDPGSQISNVRVNALGTNPGLLSGVTSGSIARTSHINYMINIYNNLYNHRHTTNDRTS